MELIRISSSKLKIMLTGEDMKKYALDATSADYDDTATRRAFWSILDDAKNQSGFNAAGDRIFVQLYPSKDGGCEMFVTKMGLLCSADGDGASGLSSKNGRLIKPLSDAAHESGGRERVGSYVFDELSSLIAVCRQLYSRSWHGKSAAYHGRDGRCYLILSERTRGGVDLSDRLRFISEFGKSENNDTVRLYIQEHGECICARDAVQILGKL